MKEVMVKAWEIAKAAVVKFGGSVKSFLSQALKLAWKEIKGGNKVVELKGSEKQIAWATEIRKEIIEALEKKSNKMVSAGEAVEVLKYSQEMTAEEIDALAQEIGDFGKAQEKLIKLAQNKIARVIKKLGEIEKAQVWIDKRGNKPLYFTKIK